MHRQLLLVLSLTLATTTVGFSAVEPNPPDPDNERIIYRFLPQGRYRFQSLNDAAFIDPIPGLDAATAARVRRRIKVDELIEGLVARIAAYQSERGALPATLAAWLTAHPTIERALLLALDPIYDDAAAALAHFDTLRQRFPEDIERYYHLAIASAVVDDSPDAVPSSRYVLIWGVNEQQWPALPGPLERFERLVDDARAGRLLMDPAALVWPLLVHVIDNDLPGSEQTWARQRYAGQARGQARALPGIYHEVRYDTAKLGHQPSLGTRPYLLANLLNPTIGGVCVDQAHVCSRIMKTFGIPAIKMRGDGRYGGAGHAWCAYLHLGQRPEIRDTGRYNQDNYWTGTAFDPQRRIVVSDRSLMMMLAGAAHDYGAAIEAEALTRIAATTWVTDPQASYALTREAIDRNPYCARAWEMLAAHYLAESYDDRALARHVTTMLRRLPAHPDASFDFITTVLTRIPLTDHKRRQAIYGQCIARVYAARPDLQLQMALAQCQELFAAGDIIAGLNQAHAVATRNAAEGRLILPLIELVVSACAPRDAAIRQRAVHLLESLTEQGFPKRRGDEITASYQALRALIDRLR